jgi:hypothetical protein
MVSCSVSTTMTGFQFPAWIKDVSLLYSIHTGTRAQLSTGYHGLFPQWQSSWCVKVTTQFHLVSSSRMTELYLHSPIHLCDMVLNQLCTRTTSPFDPYRQQIGI